MRTNIEIINIISEITGKSKRSEIAGIFNVPYTTLCTWISREIPFKRLYDFAIENHISLDYLFKGEGNKHCAENGIHLSLFKAIETAFKRHKAEIIISSTEDKCIGERLLSFREKQDLSQNQLSESIGVSLRAYQNYERGDRAITKEVVCSLMDGFGIDCTWLLSGKGDATGLSAYELAIIYNRVVMLVKLDISQDEAIKQEIQYFLEIRAAQLSSSMLNEVSLHQPEFEVPE